jgi:glycosyltransferase involved in cell wall biosynthesis
LKRLAIITTHPIQYNAPMFQLLAKRGNVQVRVFYTWGEAAMQDKYDPGFKKVIQWDIPLLDGYDFEWVHNASKDPGSHHFTGIVNPDLEKRVLQFNPDAVLVYGWSFQSHLKLMRSLKGKVKIIFRGDSTLLDQQHWLKKLVRSASLKWIYKHVDIALFTGKENKKYFIAHGLKESQLCFAPHAIDNSRFNFDEIHYKKSKELRIELGISDEDFVFLFAGKFESKKAPLLLKAAFSKLNADRIHLVFVGNGSLENQLKNEHNRSIHFLPFQNQHIMPAIYQMCDVFVLPSMGPGETWGLAVNEAMAAGKAILVSDKCGCAADLVFNGRNGYRFKSEDECELKSRMQLILVPKKAKAMGLQSRCIIEQYSFKALCESIEAVV